MYCRMGVLRAASRQTKLRQSKLRCAVVSELWQKLNVNGGTLGVTQSCIIYLPD